MESDTSTVDLQLGRILIEHGVVTEAAMREVIALQRQMELERRPNIPRLGELLVEKGYATPDQIREALAAQNRKILYCPKCAMHVNVDLRPDVLTYRCGVCHTPLVEPPSGQELKVAESSIMFVIKDPLPPEVQACAKDPNLKFGKYIVVSELGRGGVGVVHKAWDTYLGQFVALKRLKAARGEAKSDAMREAHIGSLLKEARSAIRLRHPHIATVYDVGRIGREFYMSMEYLEGETLGKRLHEARTHGLVSPFYGAPKKYLRYFRDVCRAVHYAHTRPAPVIHCDLKPSNIFLDTNDRAYVLDFGLSRSLKGLEDEPAGAVSGTPSYMAPEQSSGHTEDIDARTDVYGLGAVLYEVLSGRPPFLGSVHSILRKSMSEAPDRPNELLAISAPGSKTQIPSGLEEVCLRCLEKDRALRFQTAHLLADAIDRILKGDTGTVRRPPGTTTAPELPPPEQVAPPPPAPPAVPPPVPAGGLRQKAILFGVGALGAVAAFAVFLLVSHLRSSPGDRPATVERLLSLAADFQPDVALSECDRALAVPASPQERARLQALREEFLRIGDARERVMADLNAARPRVTAFRLRNRSIANAEIIKASATGLILYEEASSSSTVVPWSDAAPEQIIELVDRCVTKPAPADVLGLALYARRIGMTDRARRQLESLVGNEEIGPTAQRYLDER